MGISKNDIIAKNSQIDAIINNFIKNLNDFKANVNTKLSDLGNIANSVQWNGEEAESFKKVIISSKINMSNTLNQCNEIIKKLEEKSNQWAAIRRKIAASHNNK